MSGLDIIELPEHNHNFIGSMYPKSWYIWIFIFY